MRDADEWEVLFQSTLPRRERRSKPGVPGGSRGPFQTTLPRRERQHHNNSVKQRLHISIHAPAKGATGRTGPQAVERAISIHAPAKGATSTTLLYVLDPAISIHAPAKGATLPRSGHFGGDMTFQSTLPRRERRCYDKGTSSAILISIHAPAKGATERHVNHLIATTNFNPRSREGSDSTSTRHITRVGISIHAPAKGATTSALIYYLII